MSLPHTLLGVLNWRPMTGYQIKKFLDGSTQLFWHAEQSQIYPVLKDLEAQGYIQSEPIPQTSKPDKKIYSITETGRDALQTWLREPLDEIPPIKNPILLKLFFIGMLDKEEVLSQLRLQLEAHRARLKRLQQEIAMHIEETVRDSGQNQQNRMWGLVYQAGELQEQSFIRWLEMAIQAVEVGGQTTTPTAGDDDLSQDNKM